MEKTLYDKLWDSHVILNEKNGNSIIYIDRHFLHEVTSPQAFEGLRNKGRPVWRIGSNLAVSDHNVSTKIENIDPISKLQIDTLEKNCNETGILQFKMNDIRQGIVHVIGPEQGATLPGMTIVCGDSHTSTHGAFGSLAQGIGSTEVEHVLATQTLSQKKSKNMLVKINGILPVGSTAKDIILSLIKIIGNDGGVGYVMEFSGSTIDSLSMEGRMTICNMSIEAGARSGMIGVDKVTIDYIKNRTFSPYDIEWDSAIKLWSTLKSDKNAKFDRIVNVDATKIAPQVTWGTSPDMVCQINEFVPNPDNENDPIKRKEIKRALEYMDIKPNTPIDKILVDKIFIGSCTNGRIEDIRLAAKIIKLLGRPIAKNIKLAIVVPGSGLVKKQAEEEGLDKIFINAGFEWRNPGCSMCIGMNSDKLNFGERCASTSNRNFEGRQGEGGKTHLVSPAMAAAAAIKGHFFDIRKLF